MCRRVSAVDLLGEHFTNSIDGGKIFEREWAEYEGDDVNAKVVLYCVRV